MSPENNGEAYIFDFDKTILLTYRYDEESHLNQSYFTNKINLIKGEPLQAMEILREKHDDGLDVYIVSCRGAANWGVEKKLIHDYLFDAGIPIPIERIILLGETNSQTCANGKTTIIKDLIEANDYLFVEIYDDKEDNLTKIAALDGFNHCRVQTHLVNDWRLIKDAIGPLWRDADD